MVQEPRKGGTEKQPRNLGTPPLAGQPGTYTIEDVQTWASVSRRTVLRARRIEKYGLADSVLFHGMSTDAALWACDLLDLRRGAA